MNIDPTKAGEALKYARDLFTETRTQLMGVADESLPEALKAPIAALKAKVDAALAAMADRPTEQVPAAQQAAYCFESIARALGYYQELLSTSFDQMNKMVAELSPKITQLNEWQEKLDKKALITAEEAQASRDLAIKEALQKEADHRTLLQARRTQLCEAKLPAPAADDVLAGEEKAFTEAKATYLNRQKLIEEAGLTTQLHEAGELAETIYGDQRNFDRTLKLTKLAAKAPAAAEPFAAPAPAAAGTPAPRKRIAC
jgi:hypothetical protein